jgi:hypothetical protein
VTSALPTASGSREREVFLEALDLAEPAERSQFLEEACGKDGALRQRVKDLLREHEAGGDFLDTPAVNPSGGTISRETEMLMSKLKPEEAGDRIGRTSSSSKSARVDSGLSGWRSRSSRCGVRSP